MDVTQIAPLGVIGAAIAVTELLKKFVRKEIMDKIIWFPPLLVGAIGAVLLDFGKQPWNIIAWNALVYAAVAGYIVLVAKRTIK
jgi:hypothetical protein